MHNFERNGVIYDVVQILFSEKLRLGRCLFSFSPFLDPRSREGPMNSVSSACLSLRPTVTPFFSRLVHYSLFLFFA